MSLRARTSGGALKRLHDELLHEGGSDGSLCPRGGIATKQRRVRCFGSTTARSTGSSSNILERECGCCRRCVHHGKHLPMATPMPPLQPRTRTQPRPQPQQPDHNHTCTTSHTTYHNIYMRKGLGRPIAQHRGQPSCTSPTSLWVHQATVGQRWRKWALRTGAHTTRLRLLATTSTSLGGASRTVSDFLHVSHHPQADTALRALHNV